MTRESCEEPGGNEDDYNDVTRYLTCETVDIKIGPISTGVKAREEKTLKDHFEKR
jgi:hypothetical protein